MFNSFPIPKPDGGGSNIKSIQRGTASFTGSETSITVTLVTPIDTNKSLAYALVVAENTSYTDCVDVDITNGTTLTFTRTAANTAVQTVTWRVEEYNNVKSMQSGTFIPVNASDNVTITAVNMDKAILAVSWKTTANFAGSVYYLCRYSLTSSTNINFVEYNSVQTTFRLRWRLLEFY